MAIATVVLDVLKSLEIASLPPQVKAGDRVDLGLVPPGLNAFKLLSEPPKLFDIELNNIILDDIAPIAIDLSNINLRPADAPGGGKLQLTLDANNEGSAPGTTDLQLVSKAVEFDKLSTPAGTKATDIDTNEASLRALPHQTPDLANILKLSDAVKGLLSRITGTVRQVEEFSGGITGTVAGHVKGTITGTIKSITGSVKAPRLFDSEVKPEVEWYIEDGNGKRLTADTDFVLLNGTKLDDPAPSLLFLPVFAELSAGVELISHHRIFCNVTVTVEGEEPEQRKLGPVNILLPKIQLPTVLVMTDHAVDGVGYPGAVLVGVPLKSSLTRDQLTDKLRKVAEDLEQLNERLKTISQVVAFGDTTGQINRIIELIRNPNIRTPGFLPADQVMNLWHVMRKPGGFMGWGYEGWQDCISSLVMIGPPGRGARFYNKTDLSDDESGFQITLGRKGVGHIDNLTPRKPTCKPTGNDGCTFRDLIRQDVVILSTFNDIISSYEFLPLQ